MAKKKSQFQKKKSFVKGLITRANKLVNQLKEAGVYEDSFAIQEAMQSRARYSRYNDIDDLFSLEGIKNTKQLNAEKARLLKFLGAGTATIEGAEIEKRAIEANKKWAGAFFTAGVKNHIDSERADADALSIAARVYREIEERYPNLLGRTKGGLDSNTFINTLYDVVITSMNDNYFNDHEKAAMDLGSRIADLYQANLIKSNFATQDYDYGKLKGRK